ncbi:Undecaprenol kinase [Bacteroidales bacterium Barb4]|nr:Undecaprenol kinase [Bacteroidales bacterium Barb4]
MKNGEFSLSRRLAGFKYAFQGIRRLFVREANARIHAVAAGCVFTAGLWFDISVLEWLAIVIVIGAVFAAEGFNSAIEALGDAVSSDYNIQVKHAKDLAAGAVLLTAIAAAAVGLIIFAPKIFGS